ncbi:MarR family winged helix-turn-helix transcriptional regulator [Actinoplanes sp. NEAU-A12]|uniref:MarR family winged helix-turn-helix transcriptional regulator n=1 Tax=Actinoplanes sandaracinus TaxID=3045177 RepID=A0ABT6WGK6_9ACTN|nr:MarR family winged helix-turn-helix transcriptional regulator [Actinoplanes sandaracinus]MDI6098860.1 MarR family winged helix-turn-helix transcriptional regulator [Actinoplanes sandaracinus]
MNSGSVPATADPSVAEDALAAQPIGYWSGAVHRAVVTRLRDAMATIDVTQPQWWTLTRVDAGGGLTRDEVTTHLEDVADTPHDVPRAVDQLLHRGWIAADNAGRLGLTDDGRAAQRRIRALVTEVRAQIHEGVPDEEYVAALKVIRRMISNLESAAR